MKRVVGSGYTELISSGFGMLPTWLADYLEHTHFLCGCDPDFVGHRPGRDTPDGRLYSDTAHVTYPLHLANRPASDRVTTVVMPVLDEPWVVVHELGHVLDGLLSRNGGLFYGDWCPVPEPVSWYAATNRWESFAEAFTMAHVPGYATEDWAIERLSDFRLRQPELAPFFTPKETE